MEISCVKEVEQNPLPKSQTKPFYIGTKEAPSENRGQQAHSNSSLGKKTLLLTLKPKETNFIRNTGILKIIIVLLNNPLWMFALPVSAKVNQSVPAFQYYYHCAVTAVHIQLNSHFRLFSLCR